MGSSLTSYSKTQGPVNYLFSSSLGQSRKEGYMLIMHEKKKKIAGYPREFQVLFKVLSLDII